MRNDLTIGSWLCEQSTALSAYIAPTGPTGGIQTTVAFGNFGLTDAKTDTAFAGLNSDTNLQPAFVNDRQLQETGQTWTLQPVHPVIETDGDSGLPAHAQVLIDRPAGVVASNETSGHQQEEIQNVSSSIVDAANNHDGKVIAQELEAWFKANVGSVPLNGAEVPGGETPVVHTDEASPYTHVDVFADRGELIGFDVGNENKDTAAVTTGQSHFETPSFLLETAPPELVMQSLTIEGTNAWNLAATNEPAEKAPNDSTVDNPAPMRGGSSDSHDETTSTPIDRNNDTQNEPGAPIISSGASFWTVSVGHLSGPSSDHPSIPTYTAGSDISVGSLVATHLEGYHG